MLRTIGARRLCSLALAVHFEDTGGSIIKNLTFSDVPNNFCALVTQQSKQWRRILKTRGQIYSEYIKNNYIAGDNFTPLLRLSSSKAVLGLQKGGSGVHPELKIINAACRPAIDEFCEHIDGPDAPALQTRWAPSHDED
jgi:hypothetical protein